MTLLLLASTPAEAIPARMLTEPLPPAAAGEDRCTVTPLRARSGPGRRPGATVVPVVLRLAVEDINGTFIEASSDWTYAVIQGDSVALRVTARNLSLYDVGNVVFEHFFDAPQGGAEEEGIGSVTGAVYNRSLRAFVVDRIPSDGTAEFTFRLFLTGDVGDGLYQSQVRIKDFEVLEAARRFPPRTPESPPDRNRQTLERLGIGDGDVACFTGLVAVAAMEPAFRVTPPSLSPAGGNAAGPVTVEITPNTREARPGAIVIYTLTVANGSDALISDVAIDVRMDPAQARVASADGGTVTESGIRWVIPALDPGGRWTVRYRLSLSSVLQNGDEVPTSVLLGGPDLRGTPTTLRSDSTSVAILAALPETGVELKLLTIPLALGGGAAGGFLLLGCALQSALWVGRKWDDRSVAP